MSGAVPANETVYGNGTSSDDFMVQQRTYSTTVALSQGTHKLWHGAIGNTPGPVTGWVGNGWIDVRRPRSNLLQSTPLLSFPAQFGGCVMPTERRLWHT
jgi:hypothetical protein